MATLHEALERLGQPIPQLPEFSSEDLTYLIMSALLPQPNKDDQIATLANLLIAFAFKIEDLETELFELRFRNA